MNPFGHIDLRVNDMDTVLPFYEKLLPALGFIRTNHSKEGRVFAAEGELPSAAYFAITEDRHHQANTNRIAFWAKNNHEVDQIAGLVEASGGKITDGPRLFPISPSYYAVFFEDPAGNCYEVVYRVN